MSVAISLVLVLIGFVIVGFLYLEFADRNSKEPEVKRKWTDPKA